MDGKEVVDAHTNQEYDVTILGNCGQAFGSYLCHVYFFPDGLVLGP